MKVKPCNYFLDSFKRMNLINKRFNVYDSEDNLTFSNCYINDRGYVCYGEDDRELWATTMNLLTGNGYYEIIPHKKKLRDLTKDEWDKWKNEECIKNRNSDCYNCIFMNVACANSRCEGSWFNNKDLYSDKFLDQEIEVA